LVTFTTNRGWAVVVAIGDPSPSHTAASSRVVTVVRVVAPAGGRGRRQSSAGPLASAD
jgi:hypothetical protein